MILRRLRPMLPLILLLTLFTLIAVGPLFVPYSTRESIGSPWSATEGALLGTDMLGRDVWSRTLGGGAGLVWPSLAIGTATTLLG